MMFYIVTLGVISSKEKLRIIQGAGVHFQGLELIPAQTPDFNLLPWPFGCRLIIWSWCTGAPAVATVPAATAGGPGIKPLQGHESTVLFVEIPTEDWICLFEYGKFFGGPLFSITCHLKVLENRKQLQYFEIRAQFLWSNHCSWQVPNSFYFLHLPTKMICSK